MGVLRVWNGSGWDEIKGERGDTGASAYQIAVNEGFVGTEEDWLDSLAADPIDPVEIENAVATAIDAEPRVAQLVTDVDAITTTASVLSALRFDAAHPNYGAVAGTGVSPTQRTANTAAIQLAADDARIAGGTLVLKGTYEVNGTVNILCHMDASGATLLPSVETLNPVVRVGTLEAAQNVQWLQVRLPEIVSPKTGGNGVWGAGVGVEVSNVFGSRIAVPHIRNFGTNLKLTATGLQGTAYNTFEMGHLDNGKVNLLLAAGGTNGWVNENVFMGGRYSMDSNEGTAVAGTRHIKMTSTGGGYLPDNNVFIKPCLEANIPEYHLEAAGYYNVLHDARWEAQPPKVLVNGAGSYVNIDGGYDSHLIEWTFAGGAINEYQEWSNRNFHYKFGSSPEGTYIGSNKFGDECGTFTVMALDDAPNADRAARYLSSIAGNRWRLKSATASHPMVEINRTGANGRVLLGNGGGAPQGGIEAYGQVGLRFLGTFHGFFGKEPVTQPVANPNTSGATLAQLETEVNELKAALRALGLIAT